MWREASLYGVFFSPLIIYGLLAFALTLGLRAVVVRTGLHRWVWNPTLAQAASFLCILGLLVGLF